MNPTPAFKHTAQRLRQRYGLTLGWGDYLNLCAAIRHALPYLEVQSQIHGRLLVLYPWAGHSVLWVWCPETGCVVTALRQGVRPSRPQGGMNGKVRRKLRDREPYRRERFVMEEE